MNAEYRIFRVTYHCYRKEHYPLVLRQKAARLVLEIAFLVYLKQFNTLAELSTSLYIRSMCGSVPLVFGQCMLILFA